MFTDSQIRSYLGESLKNAQTAFEKGNYPIGAIIVDLDGNIVASEMNECSTTSDITAHAEILALRKLGKAINRSSDNHHFLFSSLEPCFGCSFFIARTNIASIYSALKDPHKGGISDLNAQDQFHRFFADIKIINEPFDDLREQSRELMKNYFIRIGNTDAARYYTVE
jgi:tRNA(adenine34) deaminase